MVRETGNRQKSLQLIRAVMRWAIARGYRESDPTEFVRDGLGPNPPRTVHMPAQHHSLIGEALEIIEGSKAHRATKAAVLFLALTAKQRPCSPIGEMGRIRSCRSRLDYPGESRQNRGGVQSAPQPPGPIGSTHGPRTHRRCGTGVSLTAGNAVVQVDDEQALPREPGWFRPVRFS